MSGKSTRMLAFAAALLFSIACSSKDLIVGAGLHAGQGKISTDQAIMLLRLGGLSSFRDEVYWNHVEKISGNFAISSEASRIDKLIFSMSDKAPPLLVLAYGNRFHGARQPTTDAERTAFANYATYIARRYRDKVYGFEIWNEWNIGAGNPRNSGRYGDPADYVALVKEVAPIIRKEAPKAHITCGAVADRSTAWVEETLKRGLLSYCNSISLHPYVHSEGRKAEPRHAFAWVDVVHKLIEQYSASAPTPILITELGWPNQTSRHGHPPARTAAFLAQSLLMAKSRPWIEGIWWYELVDSGSSPEEREHNFGLLKRDLSAKPAFLALKALAPIVHRSQLLDSGVWDQDRYWIRLRLPDGSEVSAIWTAGWKEAVFNLASSDAYASSQVVFGSAPALTGSSVSISVGEEPLVIRHAPGTLTVR